ncbi:DNA-binding protein [Clostridium estertheticum]|uniref:DNA-binding protein n=1 Tax=Clostridium estertheticum TaxID=238834 RepID=UPI001C0C6584|nr:DNA-binding protein [Clostridium estertheticum]MBU3216659.1 DNA-binding protein [Clostridium estertheticum]WAG54385.1 DNA-binding protein [Clostridium estertheticum]
MKSNKIYLYICVVLLSFSLVGCGSKTVVSNDVAKPITAQKVVAVKQTQTQLDAKIKKESVKADFIKLNGHESEFVGKSYLIEGTVTNIDNSNAVLPSFTVTTKEDKGVGMYSIININKVNIVKGNKVKVYGKLNGKNDIGFTELSGNVIEK